MERLKISKLGGRKCLSKAGKLTQNSTLLNLPTYFYVPIHYANKGGKQAEEIAIGFPLGWQGRG